MAGFVRRGRWISLSIQTLSWLIGGLFAAIFVVFVWLTATPAGSRWAVSLAQHYVAGLTIQSVQGSLWRGLNLDEVRYHDNSGLAIQVDTALLQLDWRQFWQGRMRVKLLRLHEGELTLPAATPAQTPPPLDFAHLPLTFPLTVVFEQMDIQALTLTQANADAAKPATTYRIDDLQAHGMADSHTLTLTLDSVHAIVPDDVSVDLSGTISLATAVPHPLTGLVQSVVTLPQGWLSSEIQLSGSLADITAQLAARWDGFETPTASLQAKAQMNTQRLSLDALTMDTLGGSVCAAGALNYAHGLTLNLQGKAAALNPAEFSAVAAGQVGFEYQFSFSQPAVPVQSAHQANQGVTPTLNVNVQRLTGSIAGTPFQDLMVQARLAENQLDGAVSDGSLAGGSIKAQAHLGLDGMRPLKLTLDAMGVSLNPWLAQLSGKTGTGPTGTLAARLAVEGNLGVNPVQDMALKFALSVPRASIGLSALNGQRSPPVMLMANITGAIEHQRLKLARSTMTVGDARLSAEGELGWGVSARAANVQAELSVPELAHLPWAAFQLPNFSGAVQLTTRLTGDLQQPHGEITLLARSLQFDRWRLAELTAQGQVGTHLAAKSPTATVRNQPMGLELIATGLTQTLVGGVKSAVNSKRWLDRLKLNLQGELPTFSSTATVKTRQQLTLSAQTPQGNLDLSARGSAQGQDWHGLLSQFDLSTRQVNGHSLGNWRLQQPVAVVLSPAKQRLDSACLVAEPLTTRQAARVCLAGEHEGQNSQGSLNIDLPLATLLNLAQPWLPEGVQSHIQLPGRLILAAQGGMDAGKTSGTLKLTLPDNQLRLPQLAAGKVFDYHNVGLEAVLKAEVLNLDFHADLPKLLRAQGAGSVALSGTQAIDLSTQANLPDLSALAFLVPQITQLNGAAAVKLHLGGRLQSPQPSGDLSVKNLAFALPDTGVAYDQGALNGKIDSTGQLVFDGQLVGLMPDDSTGATQIKNGRQLNIQGSGTLAHLPDWQLDAQIVGDAVPVLRIPTLRVDASPDIAIKATQAGAVISGSVLLPLLDARIEKLPEGVVKSSDDLVIVGAKITPKSLGYPVTGDVALKLGDAVTLTGMGFSTGLTGQLDLRIRSDNQLAVLGEIDLNNGKYKAYGQDLTISQGRLLFVGPMDDPGLAVTAQRKIDTATVGLNIAGTLYHPKTTVFSNPSMPESDALSLLLTGRRLNDSSAADGSVLLNAITSLGIAQGDDILRDVGQKFGFDSMGIDTTGGLTGTRLSVGKKIGDRLLVRYAIGVLTGVGQIITEYQLNKLFSIEITSSPVSTGGDLIYRIR